MDKGGWGYESHNYSCELPVDVELWLLVTTNYSEVACVCVSVNVCLRMFLGGQCAEFGELSTCKHAHVNM